MHTTFRALRPWILLTAIAGAGCTPLFTANPQQWRDGRVTGLVARAAIPPGVDDHCLGASDADVGAMVAIVTIHLGRRTAGYRLALPVSDGQLLHVGDDVIVQPQPCELQSSGVQPG